VAKPASPRETLTAAQVLDRFEATQRRIYGSFSSRLEYDCMAYRNYPSILERGHRKILLVVETRTDGRRVFWCEEESGQCFQKLAATTPATDPKVRWFLYDGQYSYEGGHQPLWMVEQAVQRYDGAKRAKAYNARFWFTISDRFDTDSPFAHTFTLGAGRSKAVAESVGKFARTFNLGGSRSNVVPDSLCLGTGGLVHDVGLVQKLRKAKTLVLKPRLEPVNGVPCYVLQATLALTRKGAQGREYHTEEVYRLYFDPTHDYHLAKLELTLRFPVSVEKRGIQPPRGEDKQTLDNVRFEKIGKDWVPMAWQWSRSTRRLDDPEGYTWDKGTVRRTRMLLNPDHDALGSFKPTLIQNGWAVKLRGFDGRYDQAGPLAWKDGCVVNEAGQRLALR